MDKTRLLIHFGVVYLYFSHLVIPRPFTKNQDCLKSNTKHQRTVSIDVFIFHILLNTNFVSSILGQSSETH